MSGTRALPGRAQPTEGVSQRQVDNNTGNQDSLEAWTTDLLTQIVQAFLKPPNLACVLHGDRKIRQGGRGRRTALFPSRKCGGSMPLESRLELAYAVVLERSSDIRDYRTQAIRIRLPRGRFAQPDFLVRTTSGRFEVHEVKPSIEHLPQADVERFTFIRNMLCQAGVGFRLIDIHSLPNPRVLEILLQRYARGHLQAFSEAQVEIAKSLLLRAGCCSFDAAYQLMTLNELPPRIIDFLSFHQQWPLAQSSTELFRPRGA